MTRTTRLSIALVAAFGPALLPGSASAGDWLPLATGNRWEYQGVGGAHQVETITGQTMVRGRVVSVKSYAQGVDAGLQNYWLLDADGSVLLAGFTQPGGTSWAYEPPIRILPVPPVVGPKPLQPVSVYDLVTGLLVFSDNFQVDVTEEVTLTLPAGSFHAFGVGSLSPSRPALAKGGSIALDGRRIPASGPSIASSGTTDWFSEGTGDVQYNTDDLYQLVGFGRPTPIASSTWGGLKRLYR